MPGGGSNHPANDPKSIEERLPFIKMKGNETFKVAVKAMADVTHGAPRRAGLHARARSTSSSRTRRTQRIIDAVGERLKIPAERVYKNVDRYGNTSAASIPIALDECVRDGPLEDRRPRADDGVRRRARVGLGAACAGERRSQTRIA